MWCKYIKQKSQPFVIQMIAIYFVPLKDEILNLWNGFLAIIDFIQANPDITKIIASL